MPKPKDPKRPNVIAQQNAYLGASKAYVKTRQRESELRAKRTQQIIDMDAEKLLDAATVIPAFQRLVRVIKARMMEIPSAVAAEVNPANPLRADALMRQNFLEALAAFTDDAVEDALRGKR